MEKAKRINEDFKSIRVGEYNPYRDRTPIFDLDTPLMDNTIREDFRIKDANLIDEFVAHAKFVSGVMFGVELKDIRVLKKRESSFSVSAGKVEKSIRPIKYGMVYVSVCGEDDALKRWYGNMCCAVKFFNDDYSDDIKYSKKDG